MLNQASTDRIELAKLLNISDLQLSYITHVDAGHGLIKVCLLYTSHILMNKAEAQDLKKKAKRACLSEGGLIRLLLKG